MSTFDQIYLSTERLILRPLSESDAPALLSIFSDVRVMRYWSTPAWTALSTAEERIARNNRGMTAGDVLALGIFHADSQRLLGTCDLFRFDVQCQRAEIGYGLAFGAWGQGYMQEALAALIGYGFDHLALNRIEADIDPRNIASANALLRQGFRQEGRLRERWIVSGEKSDSAMYGLLLSDWVAAKNPATAAAGSPATFPVPPATP